MIRLPMLEDFPARQYFDIIRDNNTKITYSQFGEDSIITNILVHQLKQAHGGFFVDVGAYHPLHASNTRLLKIMSWTGIHIDANEDAIALFNAAYPEDIKVCCGVGIEEGELVYYQFDSAGTNTLSPETAEEWKKIGRKLIGTKIVPVKTINRILEENLPAGQSIGYMNIDLEGFDRQVLASLDLNRFRPSIVSIEIFDADILSLGADPTISYMYSNGYKLAAVAEITYIFVDLSKVL
ncbi:FkbM family methyltransferase [Nitrospirillum sp. BR 11752]|uniref:FkbM family methyltransferase n=1 Tax=Nitrospirillum sp. BR 11752 TaxID=3104293 RepID=UPI002EAC2BC8|nr:FkbM family methyltransferase [Nitrospirillum sp. BR 11752]